MPDFSLHTGNCLDVMKGMDSECIDSIVTDPPYGLNFMSQDWDNGIPTVDFWKEAIRIAKPGTHLLAFGGTRTFHRLACNIEDAGWEFRDTIMWVYGSGFPKSLDVGMSIDKAGGGCGKKYEATTTIAKQWQGWGTAIKPAWEPILVFRKPLSGTVAENVIAYGTGAINIDECRIGTGEDKIQGGCAGKNSLYDGGIKNRSQVDLTIGRWPSNLIHDGSQEVMDCFAENSSSSRFFYCAKASKADRGEGNNHPTVKPCNLLRYICRLVTPKGGVVLDPFMGSGSTGKAATIEGFRFIGIDLEPKYVEIAKKRIESSNQPSMFDESD